MTAAILLVSFVFLHSAIRADVVAVSVSPTSPIVNQVATVTVTGQNPCGTLLIDFGDGVAQTYPVTAFPFSTQHTWTTIGAKTITTTGKGKCSGQATLTVQVIQVTRSSTILQLCARLDCAERPKMFFLKPEITALLGFSTPGGILAIAGKGFGTAPGSVLASLQTWLGGSVQRTLTVIEWTNTMVGVRWPADISLVRHQTGTLMLTTAGGGKSGPRSVTFSPELDFKTLPLVDVEVLSCGFDGNLDQCNYTVVFEPDAPASFLGYHINSWGAIGNDTGTDTYRIALKNDWAMESFHWKVSVEAGQGFAVKPTGFAPVANWSPSVKWLVTPDDYLSYIGAVTIRGPVGVPHK